MSTAHQICIPIGIKSILYFKKVGLKPAKIWLTINNVQLTPVESTKLLVIADELTNSIIVKKGNSWFTVPIAAPTFVPTRNPSGSPTVRPTLR